MRKTPVSFLILCFLFASSCSPSTPSSTPRVISVYSTFAAEPWLSELYDCAGQQADTVLSRLDDPSSAGIALRVGESKILPLAYQIDTEEILIVTQRQSPIQNLNLEGVRALFAGQGDPTLEIWAYAAGEDIQEVFNQFVMEGGSITSTAHLAANPQQMSDMLVNEPNTVGILPRHWKAGDAREVFSVATVPVLAITQNEPQGVIKELIACLQK